MLKAKTGLPHAPEGRLRRSSSNSRLEGEHEARTVFNKKLQMGLERLKKILKLGCELQILWVPKGNSNLSGEVRGDYIYIYDEDEELALETLKHEFLDYAISRVIEPYKVLNPTRK